MILEPAEGSGSCADKWDPSRLQYEPCSSHRCTVPDPKFVMKCNKSMDIVLVLDGTPKSGKKGFESEMTAAKQLVDAWTGEGITAKPNFALVHYTGPRTWAGVSKCTGMSTKKVNMETVCKIKLVQHFTDDLKKIKSKIDGLEFQKGSKLLSLGLMTVQSEFALGNKNHRTIVIVFVDGEPLSYRKTLLASRMIRKKARLVLPVGLACTAEHAVARAGTTVSAPTPDAAQRVTPSHAVIDTSLCDAALPAAQPGPWPVTCPRRAARDGRVGSCQLSARIAGVACRITGVACRIAGVACRIAGVACRIASLALALLRVTCARCERRELSRLPRPCQHHCRE